MRVLHVVSSLSPSSGHGGLQRAVLSIGQGLERHGAEVTIATTHAGRGERNESIEGLRVRSFPRLPPRRFHSSPALAAYLLDAVARFELVHVTGLFTFPSAVAPRIARLRGVPYVVSPSGMARPWALRYRSWKKAPYWSAIEKSSLRRADAVHATSEEEATELRRLLPGSFVFTVPNAVSPPLEVPSAERVADRVVFLGRIHPIKGLDLLVDAMGVLTQRRPGVELVLAGPDEVGHYRDLSARVERTRPRPRVRYIGPVDGRSKADLLSSAAVLALTSHSESFGLVVAEALSYGTPVVTTRGCPWRQLDDAGAGRWVVPSPRAIADALNEVLGGACSTSAARAVAEQFSPDRVGRRMLDQYEALRAR